MWQVTEQDFDVEGIGPGRIVVELADGQTLSVITPARNGYIRAAREHSMSALLSTDPQWGDPDAKADDGEFEVALLDRWGDWNGEPLHPQPDEWAEHQILSDGDVMYGHVTPGMIDRLVQDIGLKEE